MGLNYYLHTKLPCACCGRPYKPLHIGKSSAGWCFALHIIPEKGINDLDDWCKLWSQPEMYIENEYGDLIPSTIMEEIITNRSWPSWTVNNNGMWPRYDIYVSEEDFHRKNHSQRGPNGLLRSTIGGNCVKHGKGTWDCIDGEFS